jgi:hypothetical protein
VSADLLWLRVAAPVMPAKAGIQSLQRLWIPACAGIAKFLTLFEFVALLLNLISSVSV